MRGNAVLVEMLLDLGADVNLDESQSSKWSHYRKPLQASTPLSAAARVGDLEVAALLVEAGANVNAPEHGHAFTPLALASYEGHIGMVNFLLEEGAVTSSSCRCGDTPLLIASNEGHYDVVESLLAKGADATMMNCSGWTALLLSSCEGHAKIVSKLLETSEVHPDYKHRVTGANALSLAAGRQLLLNVTNTDVDSKDLVGRTALFRASVMGHDAIVDILLKSNARADLSDLYGSTPLSIAARKGHMRVVESLLASGATSTFEDRFGRTPIWWAKKCGKMTVLRVLAPSESQQSHAADSEANTGVHAAYCDVCVLKFSKHLGFYVCRRCKGG